MRASAVVTNLTEKILFTLSGQHSQYFISHSTYVYVATGSAANCPVYINNKKCTQVVTLGQSKANKKYINTTNFYFV